LPDDFSTQEIPVPPVQGVAPPQHACPSAPQAVQVPAVPLARALPVQANPVAVQVPLFPVPQQGCPDPPQAPHMLPPAETMHCRLLSQEPPLPPPPGQQGWPAPPHALQVPLPPSASVKQPRPP
jgi:hypothetical protein